jgi:hypothetical protein
MKIVVSNSTNKDKKLMAQFFDGDKKVRTIHFGLKGSTTYLDTGDKKLREAYRARHQAVYDKSPPMSASRLSYEIIWGDSQDINKNIASYKKRYGYK